MVSHQMVHVVLVEAEDFGLLVQSTISLGKLGLHRFA